MIFISTFCELLKNRIMYQTEKEKNDNVEMIDILMRHEVKL